MSNIKFIQDIYSLAPGGTTEIAYKLKIHPRSVERWLRAGIPDKYWNKLHEHFGVTPFECFKVNAKIRGYKNSA